MNTKHTPGPWRAVSDNTSAEHPPNDRFLLVARTPFGHFQGWASDGITTQAEDAANARLIAAAPELLAALRVALEWLEAEQANTPEDYDSSTIDADIAKIRAAIAKARGN